MRDESLSLMELSAVREMANIGLGHATTALSEVTGQSFNMAIPWVETVSIETVPMLVGDPEDLAVGISMPFEGDATGHTAFLFPWNSATDLWKMLLGTAPGSPGEIDELYASAMLEVGNIVNSGFLNAISDMTNLKLHATPPMVSVDIIYSIASSIIAEAEQEDAIGLAIKTELFREPAGSTTGYFLCVPTKDSLDRMFSALGIAEAA